MQTKEVVCIDCGTECEIPEYAALQRIGGIEFYRCYRCRTGKKTSDDMQLKPLQLSMLE